MLTDTDRAYLAGLFDGEGCVTITKAKKSNSPTLEYRAVIVISQMNKMYLDMWQQKTGLGKVYSQEYSSGAINYQWRIDSKQVDDFIDLIFEYAMVKRRELELAKQFRATFGKQGGKGRGLRVSREVMDLREGVRETLQGLNRPYRALQGDK